MKSKENNCNTIFADIHLSDEQQMFLDKAISGKNILVDACIGSGKTTAIQALCHALPRTKKILYLTYNRLLKLDAKKKIKQRNVTVTNYHGYAYSVLKKIGVNAGISDLIQTFIEKQPPIAMFDVLIIDEYQDIEQELADMLEMIKAANPDMQIIAVGDIEQKIYDKTTLHVEGFIDQFLGDYERLEFTQCFRLSAELAAKLGRIWDKTIVGVNDNCLVEEMDVEDIPTFLSTQDPKNILCLGARTSDMTEVLNTLETQYPDKFNKETVFASISDTDRGPISPRDDSAIFTTFDSSKGLERPVCVVFDFTEGYWTVRVNQPQQDYAILRNIFCVAASRGKQHIIFAKPKDAMLSEQTLSSAVWNQKISDNVPISSMFEFKYKESIEKCYSLLQVESLPQEDTHEIAIKNNDGLIDISPCIGTFQEASFFTNYDIEVAIELHFLFYDEKRFLYTEKVKKASLEKKILFLTSLETKQDRYRTQVSVPFVLADQKAELMDRLGQVFSPDECVQRECKIDFKDDNGKVVFAASGLCDVLKDDVVYELKFVSALTHEHFLQCASYMIALNLENGILWNTRTNEMYSIKIPDKELFLDEVARTVTKNAFRRGTKESDKMNTKESAIAVIDTETNWNDEVMSIGIVVADATTYQPIKELYYIFDREASAGGMYSSVLTSRTIKPTKRCSREVAMQEIDSVLTDKGIHKIFAYNAAFDKKHLPELGEYGWYDIMRIAAYKQFNSKIPKTAECCGTGRLKRNYGVESIMVMLSGNENYAEMHNAYKDAIDELKIMELLGHEIEIYDHACIKPSTKVFTSKPDLKITSEPSTGEIIIETNSRHDDRKDAIDEDVLGEEKLGLFRKLLNLLR